MDSDLRERVERLEMLAAGELRREASTGVAGLVPAADYAALRLAADPPRARAYLTGAQAAAHAAYTALSFGASRYSTPGAHGGAVAVWGAGSPTRLSALRAGLYGIGGLAQFASSAGGEIRELRVRINGTTYVATADTPPIGGGNTTQLAIQTEWQMAQGDYAEIIAYQDTGGALNVSLGEGWVRFICD